MWCICWVFLYLSHALNWGSKRPAGVSKSKRQSHLSRPRARTGEPKTDVRGRNLNPLALGLWRGPHAWGGRAGKPQLAQRAVWSTGTTEAQDTVGSPLPSTSGSREARLSSHKWARQTPHLLLAGVALCRAAREVLAESLPAAQGYPAAARGPQSTFHLCSGHQQGLSQRHRGRQSWNRPKQQWSWENWTDIGTRARSKHVHVLNINMVTTS